MGGNLASGKRYSPLKRGASNASLGFHGANEAAERLRACEALLDCYALRVFDAHDENR